jgi:hypothetical protein
MHRKRRTYVKKLVFSSITALSLVSGSAFAQGEAPNMGQPDPKMAAKCQKILPGLKARAEKILQIKDPAGRTRQFEALGKSIPKGCEPFVEPLKQEIMAKEQSMYPGQKQASAGGSNKQQNQQGQPNQGGQNSTAGQPGSMGQPDPKLAEKCQKVIPTIQRTAENILKIKDSAKRKVEFEKLGKAIPQGCEPFVEPLHQQIIAKEKAMYPDQAVASAGGKNNQQGQGNNGGQQGQSMNTAANSSTGQAKPVDMAACEKSRPMVAKEADLCLKMAAEDKRRACFDMIGKKFPQGCEQAYEGMKQEVAAKEKSLYPTQGSAIQ